MHPHPSRCGWSSGAGAFRRGALACWLSLGCQGSAGDPEQVCAGSTQPPTLQRAGSPVVDPDAGGAEGSCRSLPSGKLTTPCFPRCSPSTRRDYYACSDWTCENAVLRADATPAIEVEGTSARRLGCLECVTHARDFCLATVCGAELTSACYLREQALYEPCLFLAEDVCFAR
ncbi:MAG TPA: hypothetical protein VER33_15885 [Polyangiaceae bacterium]|nr:hypothetical protein [Polyangiaceae bacterium]